MRIRLRFPYIGYGAMRSIVGQYFCHLAARCALRLRQTAGAL
jgi:hypothetical protein